MIQVLNQGMETGFVVLAPSLEGLFREALEGVLLVIFQKVPSLDETFHDAFEWSASDPLPLLRLYVDGIVSVIEDRRRLPTRPRLQLLQGAAGWRVVGEFMGTAWDASKVPMRQRVKGTLPGGVTLEPDAQGWRAQILFAV